MISDKELFCIISDGQERMLKNSLKNQFFELLIFSATCDFSSDTCGWQNNYEYATESFQWLRGSGKTQLESTTPSADHSGDSDGIYLPKIIK